MNDSGGIHDASARLGGRRSSRLDWNRRIRSKFAVVLAAVTLLGVVSIGATGAGGAAATSSKNSPAVTKHQAVVNLTWWTMWSGIDADSCSTR